MKITLIGSGNMGSALATQIAKAGHALVITGRNADKAKELARTTGSSIETIRFYWRAPPAPSSRTTLRLKAPTWSSWLRPTRMRWRRWGLPAI